MFRNSNRRVSFRPQHGQQVLVRASITLYEPRGDYQLIIESMHPAGEGLLQQQFEQLKARLAAEGCSTSSLNNRCRSRRAGGCDHLCHRRGIARCCACCIAAIPRCRW